MPPRTRSARWLVAIAHVACFHTPDPYYCEGEPNGACQICTSNEVCPAERPVCELAGAGAPGTCVQCTPDDAGACAGPTPVCGDDRACRACRAHAECASAVCLPDGACASPSAVGYAAAAGRDDAPCTQAAPCRTIGIAVAAGRPFVKLSGSFAESVIIEGGRAVTIFADPQTTLTGQGAGPNLTVRGAGTSVTVRELVIARAPTTPTGYGVFVPPGAGPLRLELVGVELRRNPAGAISVSSGALLLTRSSLLENQGGGLYVSGGSTTFVVTDNVIAHNGRARAPVTSTFGGVTLFSNTENSRFERNTVAFNESDGSYTGGAYCAGPLVEAGGNLLYHNGEPDGLGGVAVTLATQLGPAGGCQPKSSLRATTHPSHLGLRAPLTPPFDFHLTAETPALVRDAGGACSGTDLDGELRPQGAACDLGADELVP